MRKIKFRLWDKANSQMITGKNIDVLLKNINNNDSHVYQQWTGLKDKNGVEIYEGDIVKDLRSLLKDNRANSVVKYIENLARFSFGGWQIPSGMSHTYEVIGNIYENGDLLCQ